MAKRKPSRSSSRAPSALTFRLDARKGGLEPILGAAYLMTDRAYARLSGDKKKILVVTLAPKSGGAAAAKALREAFLAEYESQKLRWAIARANAPIREYIVENAVTLAQGRAAAAAPAPAAPEELTADQRAEIERLIAEVEGEIKEMNDRKAHPDAKGVSRSWEAQAERGPEAPR